MKDLFRNIKYFLLNIYHHRKSLWYSRPWDYSGTYMVLRDNLKYLSDSIEVHGIHLNKHKQVKNMRVCINLIDRLLEDDYAKVTYVFKDDVFSFDFKVENKYFLPTVKNIKKRFELDHNLKNNDREYLFKLLNKYIEHWWD